MKLLKLQRFSLALGLGVLASFSLVTLNAQTDTGIIKPADTAPTTTGAEQPTIDKRVLGVLPNYRTADGRIPFQTITIKQKFVIATKDSFDYPVLGTTSFFAGLSQLRGDDNKIYGQGVEGFAHRFGISYLDQVVGNYFPEAIIPAVFHMDPRYFRKAEGTIMNRLIYSITRVVLCKTDSGRTMICAPEIIGNASAATFALSYHPHERTVGDAAEQFGSYMETDLVGDILKEFWPDIKRKFGHRQHPAAGASGGE